MSSNNETKNRIIFETDEQAKNKLLRAYEQLSKAQKSLATETLKGGTAITRATKESQALAKSNQDLKDKAFQASKALQDELRNLSNLEAQAKDTGNALSNIQSPSIGGTGADIRGAIGSIAGDSAGAGLELAAGVGDAVEAFGSLNPAVAASTIAIVALSAVMATFTREAEAQADRLNNLIDAQRSVGQAVAGGLTTEEANARIEELNRLREDEQARLTELQGAYDEAIGTFGAFGGVVQQISAQEQALADQIATSRTNVQSYTAEINALSSELDNGGIAANDTAIAEAELAQTREQESQAAIQAAEQSAARIAQLEQQRADLINNRAIAEANANESEALERQFAREDEKAELQKHIDNLTDIRAEGARRIAAIDQSIADLPKQQAQAINEAQSKANQQLSKLQDDYHSEQIKATRDFAKEQGRISSDTAKAAKRLAEDIADSLADAVRDNDVIAFLKIQRDGQKDLKRNAEDAREEEKRRTEDFIEAQNAEREAYFAKQAEIQAALATERQTIANNFAQRQSELLTQRATELANTQQALANAKTRYEQEEALEAQQASRDAQRKALREQQEQEAFNRQLGNIAKRIQAEQSAYASIGSSLLGMIAQVRAAAQAASASRVTPPGLSPAFSGGTYNNPYQQSGFGSKTSSANINIYNTVGDVATGSQVSAALNANAQQIIGMFAGAISKAQGG